MTHPRIVMFLDARDKARARGDTGIDRAVTADLRRLGVSDSATLADPTGRNPNAKRGPGRPAKARCEHGTIVDRCPECADDSVTVAVPLNSRIDSQAA